MTWESRGRVVVEGAREGAADVAALRAELAAARGQLAAIQQAAPAAIGTVGQQALAARSPWAGLAGDITKAQKALGGAAAPKGGGLLAQAKAAAGDAKKFLVQAGAKLKGDTSGAASAAASKATGIAGAAGAALLAAAGVAGVASLTRLALGYRGVAQLQMLGLRTQLQFRQLFSGVNPAPVVRAADRFLQMFSKGTVEGKALEGLFGRMFNGLFRGVEAAEPYATAFVDGLILGSLKVENAWLRARIALFPITEALGEAMGKTDGLALAADTASAAFRALATVIDTVAAGTRAVADAYNAINNKVKRQAMPESEQIRLGNQDRERKEQAAREDARMAASADKVVFVNGVRQGAPSAAPKAAGADAVPAMQKVGADSGMGFVKGLDSTTEAIAAAGGRAGKAAERGARDATQTHSPSVKFRKLGRDLGAGEELGLRDSEDGIQTAAAQSMVPRVGGGGATATSSPRTPAQVTINVLVSGAVGARQEELRAVARQVFGEEFRAVALALGVPVALGGT